MADLKAAALLMCAGGDDGDESKLISIYHIYNSIDAPKFPFVYEINFIGYVLCGAGTVDLEVRAIRNATRTRMNTAEVTATFKNGVPAAPFLVRMHIEFLEPGQYTMELWHHEDKLLEQVLMVRDPVHSDSPLN